ncbi:sensor histidine kinase [Nocardioides mesophilus]|uniref:sensor histidine kinase n=1 Tax=Nocardioides mesophilus TaxID=433659 RepID=UPI001FE92F38|nr:histidine kinase [Nocardioides mesophilus]
MLALAFSLLSWLTASADRSAFDRVGDVALGLVAFALVAVRRRWPVAVAVGTTALAALTSLAAGPAILATVSLATGRRWRPMLVVGALAVVGGEVFTHLHPWSRTDPPWLVTVLNAALIAASMAWGMYVGSRRELIWSLECRAAAAESERDLRAARSRLEERARIAREMHDVLAHRISHIAIRAGALHYRTDISCHEMRDTAGAIRESAHLALIDLRAVLGVLRDEAGELERLPQPAHGDLADLIEEARRSGMRVTWSDHIADDAVPDGVGRTIYRIVQEGLTNAGKHAPGADVEIELAGTAEEGVTVVVRNALGFGRSSTPGAGLGLVGLTERAQLSGGRLEHGREGRDFVVRTWVPWTP